MVSGVQVARVWVWCPDLIPACKLCTLLRFALLDGCEAHWAMTMVCHHSFCDVLRTDDYNHNHNNHSR
jgi:hypothetical protein